MKGTKKWRCVCVCWWEREKESERDTWYSILNTQKVEESTKKAWKYKIIGNNNKLDWTFPTNIILRGKKSFVRSYSVRFSSLSQNKKYNTLTTVLKKDPYRSMIINETLPKKTQQFWSCRSLYTCSILSY